MLAWLPALTALFALETTVAAADYVENLYWPHGSVENIEEGSKYQANTKSRYNLQGRLFADGKHVVIRFPLIRIEGYEDLECENDWLAVYAENQTSQLKGVCDPSNRLLPSLGVFCNHHEPPELFCLPGQNVTIEFCSDQLIEDEGFLFTWKTVSHPQPVPPPRPKPPVTVECGETFFMGVDEERVIYSPGFQQGRYPPNVRCKWRVKGAGTVFMLDSQHFELEDDDGHRCLPDRLMVHIESEDEAASYGPYCGRQAPEIMVRPKNNYVVTIEFSSDSKVSWSGFKLLLRTAYPKLSTCGRTVLLQNDETKANFYTPDYPAFNQRNKVCKFTVRRRAYTKYNAFEVRFKHFSLNGSFSNLTISSGGRSDSFAGEMKSGSSLVYAGRGETLQLTYAAKGDLRIGDRLHAEIRLLVFNPRSCKSDKFSCRSGQCVALEKFCNGIPDCKDGSDETNELCCYGDPIRRKHCGFSDVQPNLATLPEESQHVVEAKAHSWPWSAAVIRKGQKGNAPVCYATLIGRHWLITSASCMERNSNPNAYVVRLGSSDLSTAGEEKLFEIGSAIKHPEFDHEEKNKPAKNDLMLLKLEENVEFSKTIIPACLPSTNFLLPDNVYCMALGWMNADNDGRRYLTQEVLMTVNATECAHAYQWIGNVDSTLCTQGKDPTRHCFINTGSSLLWRSYNGYWFLHGVMSTPRCPSFLPGAYVRVTKFLKFVYDTILLHDK